MSVNLEKHRAEILSSWKDVLDDKTDTNWVLYGYEGASNDLKVVDHGSGGLDELVNELNSGKIMYAFARVEDSKTSLSKNLLINWQGEGAPVLRKGTCANHMRDIAKILTGAHLTINARTDDDVDVDRMMAKLSATGSAYNFKKPVVVHEERPTPIGTAYSRVVPAKEINTAERDSFWRKEEEEEKRRLALETERKQQELVQSEKEWRAREEKENVKREQLKQNVSSNAQNATSPSTNADILRQQRNKEARELIGGRVGTAKAVFTQQLCTTGRTPIIPIDDGEDDGNKYSGKAAPAKPVRNSIAQRINSLNNPTDSGAPPTEEVNSMSINEEPVLNAIAEVVTPEVDAFVDVHAEEILTKTQTKDEPIEVEEVNEENAGDQFSTIKRSPHTKTNDSAASTPAADVEPPQMLTKSPDRTCGTGTEDDIIYQDVMAGEGLKARALYDYQAADESEITFDPGDLITHIDQIDEGWWQGLGPDGAYGLFPANYVELLP